MYISYYTIILYNITINGYEYEYLAEGIGGMQKYNNYIYDLMKLFNDIYSAKCGIWDIIIKYDNHPDNIFDIKTIKIYSNISYNFLSNEEYILKFKEYYIKKYDIDRIFKNNKILEERNKDLKNEILKLKNYNTILLNKITDLENNNKILTEIIDENN